MDMLFDRQNFEFCPYQKMAFVECDSMNFMKQTNREIF
jgi:hypothetical protein